MKKTIRHKFLLGLLSFTVLLTTVPSSVFAVSGSVYFYPTGDVQTGSQFTVDIRGNVPGPGWGRGGGATIRVAYDATKLELIDKSDVGGVFRPNNGQNWNGSSAGLLRYEARIFFGAPGVNDQKIFNATFKAIAPGATTLSFDSANVNDGPTTGASSAFTIRNPTCPAGQIGTPPNCTTPPKPSPSPTPKPSTTPRPSVAPRPSVTPQPPAPAVETPAPTVEETPAPTANSQGGLKIENVKITANRQSNSVSWTVNQPDDVQPTFLFGSSKANQKTESKVVRQEDGSYTAELPSLKLGSLYHFTIKVASTDQLSGANHFGTITTRGYPVQLTIKQNGVLAAGAKVRIGDRSFTANKNAIITTELSDGNHEASITPAGSNETMQVSFTVQKKSIPGTGNPELQSFILNGTLKGASGGNDSTAIMTIIGSILAALLGIGGLIAFLLYRRKQQSDEAGSLIDTDALAAYGPSLQESRDMTPEPNLQASSTVATTFNDTPVTAETLPDYDQQFATDPTTYATQGQPLDPTMAPSQEILPMPPEGDPYSVGTNGYIGEVTSAMPAEPDAFTNVEPSYSTTEMLPPVADELYPPATTPDPVVDEEPSAVFDAATGELEILHKHSPSTATSAYPAAIGGTRP